MRKDTLLYWSLFSIALIAILIAWLPGFVRRTMNFREAFRSETAQPTDEFSQKWKNIEGKLKESLLDIETQMKSSATSTPASIPASSSATSTPSQ